MKCATFMFMDKQKNRVEINNILKSKKKSHLIKTNIVKP